MFNMSCSLFNKLNEKTKIVAFFIIEILLQASTLRIENHPYPFSLRPYHVENTGSRLITEVKLRRAELVLGRGTTWEHSVS
ncbi:hypothetical protein DERF_011982 [Dermatophagoides farinae]|uniref:Uncharacterized protein n=1 Tax=Dermatophagoides farinae TaxID=6954 RepID=A0A922HP38_DERFA|nr:hypothetical protein DERF_011982 [Dermatophagoides farinae]